MVVNYFSYPTRRGYPESRHPWHVTPPRTDKNKKGPTFADLKKIEKNKKGFTKS